jgi:hypothetical protein
MHIYKYFFILQIVANVLARWGMQLTINEIGDVLAFAVKEVMHVRNLPLGKPNVGGKGLAGSGRSPL